jgi:hypothetical protein
MVFEWDPRKAASNRRKHGVSFADACSVLEDTAALTIADEAHEEERWITIGMDSLARVLVVIYTWRGKSIRIISARAATNQERSQYLENT